MKYVALVVAFIICFASCDQKPLDPAQRPLVGTYEVTHLKQYQDGNLVFEGELPAILGDTILIKHGLSIELSTLKSSTTDAFISYHMVQTRSNADSTRFYTRSYGRPIAQNQIAIKAAQGAGIFAFYKSTTTLLGTSDGQRLSFDFTEPDSLGHAVRYVYEAKKTFDRPNQY